MNHIDAYLKLRKDAVRPNTYESDRITLGVFQEYLKKDILQVTVEDIISFLTSLNINSASKHNYLNRINGFYEYLVDFDLINKNPCIKARKYIGKIQNGHKLHKALTLDELKKLMRYTLNPRNRALILTMFKTSARLAEIINLKVDDVDFSKAEITLSDRKGGKASILPMDTELMDVLSIWLKLRPKKDNSLFGLKRSQIIEIVKKAGNNIGIENLMTHDLRYSCTTILAKAGCLEKVIEIIRGDSPRNMVSYYTDLKDTDVKSSYLKAMPKILN